MAIIPKQFQVQAMHMAMILSHMLFSLLAMAIQSYFGYLAFFTYRTASKLMALPVELQEMIAGHCDPASLRNLRLTNSHFRIIATSALFEYIWLPVTVSMDSVTMLEGMIRGDLARRARHIKLIHDEFRVCWDFSQDPDSEDDLGCLSSVLKSFGGLTLGERHDLNAAVWERYHGNSAIISRLVAALASMAGLHTIKACIQATHRHRLRYKRLLPSRRIEIQSSAETGRPSALGAWPLVSILTRVAYCPQAIFSCMQVLWFDIPAPPNFAREYPILVNFFDLGKFVARCPNLQKLGMWQDSQWDFRQHDLPLRMLIHGFESKIPSTLRYIRFWAPPAIGQKFPIMELIELIRINSSTVEHVSLHLSSMHGSPICSDGSELLLLETLLACHRLEALHMNFIAADMNGTEVDFNTSIWKNFDGPHGREGVIAALLKLLTKSAWTDIHIMQWLRDHDMYLLPDGSVTSDFL